MQFTEIYLVSTLNRGILVKGKVKYGFDKLINKTKLLIIIYILFVKNLKNMQETQKM